MVTLSLGGTQRKNIDPCGQLNICVYLGSTMGVDLCSPKLTKTLHYLAHDTRLKYIPTLLEVLHDDP